MTGGSLNMSLDVGPVSASCLIILDVFINFKPFYFIAEVSLSVNIRCNIDILFIHIHISISIGADIILWGPETFGGLAHVDFWFFGFDIRFGSGQRSIPGISLAEFYEMVQKPGPASAAPATDKTLANDPHITQHKYSVEAGLFPSAPESTSKDFPNTGAGTEWLVTAANLQIRIDCDFALTEATLFSKTSSDIILPSKADSKASYKPFYAFPMHTSDPLKSTLEIRIYTIEGDKSTLMSGFTAELVLKTAPPALWTKYDRKIDPLVTPNPPSLTSGSNPTLTLCQGVRIFAPEAIKSRSPIIDFDATAAMKKAYDYDLHAPPPAQARFFAQPLEEADKPWDTFGEMWGGKTDVLFGDAKKSEIRGDDAVGGGGLVGLAADFLGWKRRGTGDKEGNVVVVPDGGRMEWELKGDPPVSLAEKLGDYYPALPLMTSLNY